jgi:hypothetical protein
MGDGSMAGVIQAPSAPSKRNNGNGRQTISCAKNLPALWKRRS